MSITSSQSIPNSHGHHHDSSNPSPTTSAPYPDAISLTNLRSTSGDSIHSSASTVQVTPHAPSPLAQPTPGNAQAVTGQTWYRKTWIHIRKTLGSWCTACGPPQLLVGLVGLVLAIPLLKLSIYSYQLSQWTAWKDFRQDCKSLNLSFQSLSKECEAALSRPLTVPPHVSFVSFVERGLARDIHDGAYSNSQSQSILAAALFASTTVALILIAASLSTFGSLFSSEFYVLETRDLHAEALSTTATGEGVGSNISSNGTTNSPLPIRSGMPTMRILGRLWRQRRFLPPSQDPSCLVFQEPDSKVGKLTSIDLGKGSISKVKNDPQARPWAVFERWRLEKDSTSATAHKGHPWSRIRKTKLVTIQAFQGGQHQSAHEQCKLLGAMDNAEDLDGFQKHQIDSIIERKIEEQPGFEWNLVGAQLFSTGKERHQNLPSPEERRLEDYLDVSIRGMAHDFANLSNYHQFEQLIIDRHLSKNYLIELAAGRPRLDKGDGFDLAQLYPLEKKVPKKEIDEAELVDIDVVEDKLPQADIAQGEDSEIGVVKTTAQLYKTHEKRDLLYGFAKGFGANAPRDSVVPTGGRKNHQPRVSGEGESIHVFHVLDKTDPYSVDIAGERDAVLGTGHQPSLAMLAEDRASPLRNPQLTSRSALTTAEAYREITSSRADEANVSSSRNWTETRKLMDSLFLGWEHALQLKVQISNLEMERTQTLAESKGYDQTDFNLDEAGVGFLAKYATSRGILLRQLAEVGEKTLQTLPILQKVIRDDCLGSEVDTFPAWLSFWIDMGLSAEQFSELRKEPLPFTKETEPRIKKQCTLGCDKGTRDFLCYFDARYVVLEQELAMAKEKFLGPDPHFLHLRETIFKPSFNQFENTESPAPPDELFEAELFDKPDPLLLPQYAYRFNRGYPDMSSTSSINEWLLHKLRNSASEVRLFKSFIHIELKLSETQVKDLALELWFKEEPATEVWNCQRSPTESNLEILSETALANLDRLRYRTLLYAQDSNKASSV